MLGELELTRLIDDLLDITRIERGKFDLRTERMSLWPAVTSAADAVLPMMQAKRQELVVREPAIAIHVDGDAVRLQSERRNERG